MTREDSESTEVCVQCGTTVMSLERSYAFGAGNVLCSSCAVDRGGRYDAERDTWARQPDVADLPDEAYGAAPHERRRTRT